jgi:NAD-dependent DNA ligase
MAGLILRERQLLKEAYMEERDLVTIVVDREKAREIQLAKLDSVSAEALVESLLASRARDLYKLVKVLISQIGKEKAKKIIEEAQYTASYKSGREAAEKAGNPKDIGGYIEVNNVNFLGNMPMAPLCEVVERTKNRYVFRNKNCYHAEAVLKVGAGDPEALEVIKCFCSHDTPWARGFNPNMKFKRTKFVLDGDDCCEFVAEVE